MDKIRKFYYDYVSRTIEGYGYKYSLMNYLISLFLFYCMIAIAGIYFKLTFICLVIIFSVVFACFPIIVVSQFKYLYNNKQYENLVGYLEQMIFSFKRSPMILDCFKCTVDIVEEGVAVEMYKAIEMIESDSKGDGYIKAFHYIESVYPCSRVQALHSFMLSVEQNGGKYQHAIDVLLEDIRSWISRTYGYQKELTSVKSKIGLSIILSLFIAGTMMVMVPSELVQFGDNYVYLVATTTFFIALIILFVFVQVKLNGSWLVNDLIQDEFMKKEYVVKQKKLFIQSLLYCPIVLIGCILMQPLFICLGIALIMLQWIMPYFKKYTYSNKEKRAIQKSFPFWLRDISLQIQSMIVPLAIKESIESAPIVLQPHLSELVYKINDNPDSISPYNDFLKDYQIPDITNAMKMLYSIQTLHVRDIQIQLTALIKRNQTMLEKAEKIKNEDTLAGIGFFMAIPMLLATLKLLVDLGLILISFMTMTSGI